jgi:hypothetical protein
MLVCADRLKAKCVEFQGYRDKQGYGRARKNGKPIRAHVLAYEEAYGIRLPFMIVRHLCNNPSCINPDHLILGTLQDNVADRVRSGNSARGSHNGRAKLTEAQAQEIREILAVGKMNFSQIARKYGVDRRVIYQIRKGLNWKHVQ